MKHTPLYMVNFLIYTFAHYTFYTFYSEIYYIPLNHGSCSWFYRFRLFMFLVLQNPAFHICSWFYRIRLFMFLVLQNPAFHVPGFTDSGFSCSWFYRFRLFMLLVLQIPAFHVPGFLVPRSSFRSPFLVLQIARKLS